MLNPQPINASLKNLSFHFVVQSGINPNSNHIIMKTLSPLQRNFMGLGLVTGLLLLIPFTAMQLSNEVDWSLSDFILAGILIMGTGSSYLLIRNRISHSLYRFAAGIALAASLFMVWSNLAVGLIGSENNPANLMYFGVLAIGILGTAISRLNAKGMSNTLYVMTASLLLIIVIALITGLQDGPYSSVLEIVLVNLFFMFPFALSAILFRHAANDESADRAFSD